MDSSKLALHADSEAEAKSRKEQDRRNATEDAKATLDKKAAEEEAALERERTGPDPNDPEYLQKLADRMLSDNSAYRSEAVEALLKAVPATASPEAKKKVARAFKSLAEDDRSSMHDEAIRGLVKWAGKYSIPVLLTMLKGRHSPDEERVIKALADLTDARAAPALAAQTE